MAGSGRERILAIDVVRGLAVVGMLLVNNAGIPAAMPQELRHAAWQGLTLADQVFPLFLFSVGASMPFSRRAQRPGAVLRRVVVLFLLGCLLVSAKHLRLAPSTGVLQQIAGAYLLAWALLRLPRRAQLPAAALLLAGLWAAFTFVPASWRREGWVHRVITQGQIRSARSPAPRHLNTRSIRAWHGPVTVPAPTPDRGAEAPPSQRRTLVGSGRDRSVHDPRMRQWICAVQRLRIRARLRAWLQFKSPKTEAGYRDLALPAFAVTALRRHRADQAAQRLALGADYADMDLVVCNPDGRPVRPDYSSATYRNLVGRCACGRAPRKHSSRPGEPCTVKRCAYEDYRPALPPEIHVHTLRHSVASFLAAAGLPPSDLADVLGHADGGALALRAYVHLFQENKRLAADHLDRAIGDAEQPIGLQSVA